MKGFKGENVAPSDKSKRRWLALLAAAFAGIFSAAQALVNSQLGEIVSSAFVAAWFSYTSGLVLIVIWLGIRGLMRLRERRANRPKSLAASKSRLTVRWWFPVGGAIGATYVLIQTFTVSPLGVAQFVLIVLIGSLWGSAVADRFGISPAGVEPMSLARLGSLLLGTAALALLLGGQGVSFTPGAALGGVVFLAGFFTAWQQGLNSRIAAMLRSTPDALLVNFVSAAALLTVVMFFVARSLDVASALTRVIKAPPVMLTGGVLGLALVSFSMLSIRRLGVFSFTLVNVFAQVGTATIFSVTAHSVSSLGPTYPLSAALVVLAFLVVHLRRTPR